MYSALVLAVAGMERMEWNSRISFVSTESLIDIALSFK